MTAPLSTPPVATVSVPPLLIVAAMLLPPALTRSCPPLSIVPTAVPPAETNSVPPLRIAAAEAMPPCAITWSPPLDTVAPLATPPEDAICLPPLVDDGCAVDAAHLDGFRSAAADRGRNALAAGAHSPPSAEIYRRGAGQTAGTNQQLTAGIDSDRGSGAARADDLDPTAIDGESEQKAAVEREAAAEDLAGTAADKSALGGAAVADILLTAGTDKHKLGHAGDDLLAAEPDKRNQRRATGRNDLRAAGADRRTRCRPARHHDLRAGEDRGAAGEPRIELRAALDQGAEIDTPAVNDLDTVAEDGRRVGQAAAENEQRATARNLGADRLAAAGDVDETTVDRAADGAAGEHIEGATGVDNDARTRLTGAYIQRMAGQDGRHCGDPAPVVRPLRCVLVAVASGGRCREQVGNEDRRPATGKNESNERSVAEMVMPAGRPPPGLTRGQAIRSRRLPQTRG